MITEELLLENGYKKFTPQPFIDHPGSTVGYQKQMKMAGKCVYLTAYKYTLPEDMFFSWDVQFETASGFTFNINSVNWKDASLVWIEEFFRQILIFTERI